MEPYDLGEKLGTLNAGILAAEKRLTEHIDKEEETLASLFTLIKEINDTLSQAQGARKFFVWSLATVFAAVALMKGWLSLK